MSSLPAFPCPSSLPNAVTGRKNEGRTLLWRCRFPTRVVPPRAGRLSRRNDLQGGPDDSRSFAARRRPMFPPPGCRCRTGKCTRSLRLGARPCRCWASPVCCCRPAPRCRSRLPDPRRGPRLALPRGRLADAEWRTRLSAEQFRVTRRGGAERPFTGEHWDRKDAGTYRYVCCGLPLFKSADKFDSRTGWPSFRSPAAPRASPIRADRELLIDAAHGGRLRAVRRALGPCLSRRPEADRASLLRQLGGCWRSRRQRMRAASERAAGERRGRLANGHRCPGGPVPSGSTPFAPLPDRVRTPAERRPKKDISTALRPDISIAV